MKNPNPNTEIRINDRFFLGGPLTLRGFNTKGVGPHSEGESSGQRPSYSVVVADSVRKYCAFLTTCTLYSPVNFSITQQNSLIANFKVPLKKLCNNHILQFVYCKLVRNLIADSL